MGDYLIFMVAPVVLAIWIAKDKRITRNNRKVALSILLPLIGLAFVLILASTADKCLNLDPNKPIPENCKILPPDPNAGTHWQGH